jgi:hypothetical protein
MEGSVDIEDITIAEWIPDGQKEPTQVHMIIRVKGVKTPLVMRFKASYTLDKIIAALTEHRNAVFPNN